MTEQTKIMSTGQQSACAKVLTFTLKPVVCAHSAHFSQQNSSGTLTKEHQCNKLHFVLHARVGRFGPYCIRGVCVAPFISVVCGHGIGLVWLCFVFVSEVLVSSAIRNPECRSIQRRL